MRTKTHIGGKIAELDKSDTDIKRLKDRIAVSLGEEKAKLTEEYRQLLMDKAYGKKPVNLFQ